MNFLYVSSHAADRGAAVELSMGALCQSICIDPHLHDWHGMTGSVQGRTLTPVQAVL